MRRMLGVMGLIGAAAAALFAQDGTFETPFRVTTNDKKVIDVGDGNGCACAALVDVDEDGIPDLVVGQFDGGRMRVHRGTGEAKARTFLPAKMLMAAGAVAEVPMS